MEMNKLLFQIEVLYNKKTSKVEIGINSSNMFENMIKAFKCEEEASKELKDIIKRCDKLIDKIEESGRANYKK